MTNTVTQQVASLESILREYEVFARAEETLLAKYRFALESIEAIKKNGVCRGTMESIETQLTDLSWQAAMFPSQPSQMSVNYAVEAIDKTRAGIIVTVLTGILGILYKLVKWVLDKFKGYDKQLATLEVAKATLRKQVVAQEKQLTLLLQKADDTKQARINTTFFKSPQFQQAKRGGDFFLALMSGELHSFNLNSYLVQAAFPRVVDELTYEYNTLFNGYQSRSLTGYVNVQPLADSTAFWDLTSALPRGIDPAGKAVIVEQTRFKKDPNDVLRAIRDGVTGLLNTPSTLTDSDYLAAVRQKAQLDTTVTGLFPASQDMTTMRKNFDALQSKFIALNNSIRQDAASGGINQATFDSLNKYLTIINIKFQALSNVLFILSQLVDGVGKLLERNARCLAEYGRQVTVNS